jgi:putative protease
LNSRDLCLIDHIKELADAGVASCKIEGRMKSEYYVGGTVNAYRRKMNGEKFNTAAELEKLPHRPFTTGFTFGDKNKEFTESTRQTQTYEVIALSLGENKVRQKNYFAAGDEAEILSPTATFNKTFIIDEIYDTDGNKMPTAKTPEQIIQISCPFTLAPGDILRKKSRSVH